MYALIFCFLGIHQFARDFVHIHYHLSVMIWSGITAAFLIICANVLRTREALHPADLLIAVPWCLFYFSPVSFNVWDDTIGLLPRWIDPDWSDHKWVNIFMLILPYACGAIVAAWQLSISLRRGRAWRFLSGMILASYLLHLGIICVESIDWLKSFAAVIADCLYYFECWLPVMLAIAIACTGGAEFKNGRRLGAPRWAMIVFAECVCLLQTAYQINLSFWP